MLFTTRNLTFAASLVAFAGTATPSFADSYEQWLQISYRHAQQLCGTQYDPNCQGMQKVQATSAHHASVKQQCFAGNQAACSSVRAANQRAVGFIRQDAREKARPYGGGSGGSTGPSVADINSSILDDSHSGFMGRNDMDSDGHTSSINGIYGRQTVTNPNTGSSYTVDGFQNDTWIDNSGNYIGSDNPNYDPNADYDGDWQRYN